MMENIIAGIAAQAVIAQAAIKPENKGTDLYTVKCTSIGLWLAPPHLKSQFMHPPVQAVSRESPKEIYFAISGHPCTVIPAAEEGVIATHAKDVIVAKPSGEKSFPWSSGLYLRSATRSVLLENRPRNRSIQGRKRLTSLPFPDCTQAYFKRKTEISLTSKNA